MNRLLILPLVAVLAVGCTSKTAHVTTPAATGTPAPGQTAPAATTATTKAVAHVGDTLNLSFTGGNLAVTIVKVFDPATPGNRYLSPDAGKRFVAVQASIKNLDSQPISGDPQADIRLIDTANQTFEFDLGGTSGGVKECQVLSSSINLGAGEITAGCSVFSLPTATKIGKVEFTPQAGFSSTSGTWLVP